MLATVAVWMLALQSTRCWAGITTADDSARDAEPHDQTRAEPEPSFESRCGVR